MRLIDAEELFEKLKDLYEYAGWDEREVHFSLRDLESNISLTSTIEADMGLVLCSECKYNPNNPRVYADDDVVGTYTFCEYLISKNGFCSCGRRPNDYGTPEDFFK